MTAAKAMIAGGRHGSIVHLLSTAAHFGQPAGAAYCAAKAALLNLARCAAMDLAPHGIRVNTITPGFFPAEQNRRVLFNPDGTPTARTQTIMGHTPMERFGEPHELIGAAIFLASSRASSFVTGADVRVDGGFLCRTI